MLVVKRKLYVMDMSKMKYYILLIVTNKYHLLILIVLNYLNTDITKHRGTLNIFCLKLRFTHILCLEKGHTFVFTFLKIEATSP